MPHRLRRTLRRRERLLHVRELQEERAQLDLAHTLREEEEHRRERDALGDSQTRTRAQMLQEMGDATRSMRSDELIAYARQIEALTHLIEAKERDILAMQPAIQERRQEVLRRYRARRAMEVLASKTRENVQKEDFRMEQQTIDELTTQRHGGRRGDSNPTA